MALYKWSYLRGVSGLSLWKKYFELGVGGKSQDTSRHFEGSFGSVCAKSKKSPAFFDFWLNFFGGLNQKSATICMCKILRVSDKFIEKFSRHLGE